MRLSKWQGLGNDYLILDEKALPAPLTPAVIALLCDRHYGLGSDGILLHTEPTGAVPGAVARMRIFNPDGSEPEMCGNGIRMFARYLVRSGLTAEREFVVETGAGVIRPQVLDNGLVKVDMGSARFRSEKIDYPGQGEVVEASLCFSQSDATLQRAQSNDLVFTFVDIGNPHCVILVDDPATFAVNVVGPLVENHPHFPQRTNVEFVRVEADGSVTMRVWERGVGETQACGTGATAVGVACVHLGLVKSPVTVHLLGGDLLIEVDGAQAFMTGPAEEVCWCEPTGEFARRLGWAPGTDE